MADTVHSGTVYCFRMLYSYTICLLYHRRVTVNELQFVMYCAINEKMQIHKASGHSQGTSKEARGMTETGHNDLRKRLWGSRLHKLLPQNPCT
jgi:hypothetical protein